MSCTCHLTNIESYENFDLKNFNTLKISAKADLVYFVKNEAELLSVFQKYGEVELLGWGSNTLISSDGIKKPLIVTRKFGEISARKNIVEVSCGASVQKFSKYALENSLSGVEFLIGIPSSLGGAVAMNAGAHGQQIEDTIISARVLNCETKEIVELTKSELDFSYRSSLIKKNPKKYVVLSAKFELVKKDAAEIEQVMKKNTEFRKKVQPSLAMPNLGSVFKNPNNAQSAGSLIEQCGLKGLTVGGAQVFLNHANFIINFENSTSLDYSNLTFKMYDSVKEKFNISLEPEVVRMGEFSDMEEELWNKMKNNWILIQI